jgi:hypothetical protein
VSEGHALIVPRRHIPAWFEASTEEQAAIFGAIETVSEIIRAKRPVDGLMLTSTLALPPDKRFRMSSCTEFPAETATCRPGQCDAASNPGIRFGTVRSGPVGRTLCSLECLRKAGYKPIPRAIARPYRKARANTTRPARLRSLRYFTRACNEALVKLGPEPLQARARGRPLRLRYLHPIL